MKKFFKITPVALIFIVLGGCATRPTYETMIDPYRRSEQEVWRDTQNCKQQAQHRTGQNEGIGNGAIVGAAAGAAYGHGSSMQGQMALNGAVLGALGGAVLTLAYQNGLTVQCMVSKGYQKPD